MDDLPEFPLSADSFSGSTAPSSLTAVSRKKTLKTSVKPFSVYSALDPERGDSLQIIRGNILSEVKENITWSLSTAYMALLFGIVGLTVIFFAFKAAHSLGASVKSAENLLHARAVESSSVQTIKTNATEEESDADNENPSADSPSSEETTAPSSKSAGSASPSAVFGSFGESSALAVASFLAGQPAAKAAALISVLRPDTAGSVLETVSPAFRLDVLKALGENFNVTDADKEILAAPLATFVRTFVHGPECFWRKYLKMPRRSFKTGSPRISPKHHLNYSPLSRPLCSNPISFGPCPRINGLLSPQRSP